MDVRVRTGNGGARLLPVFVVGAVVIVEQFARLALEVADRAYLLVNRRVDRGGTTESLRANVGEIESKFLGVH